ncbi:MAG: hypothetical protein IJ739_04385 [Bacteroidaceae bacterium]|nr:hypothetical protein [Bacteroidaceae bacterium]
MMTSKKTTTAKSLPGGDSATYLARPKGRPDVTMKGKMNEWANGYREFIPQGTKASNRTMLKQLGNSSFYKSEGEKDSSYSLHLNVAAKDCADPVGELYQQFQLLTEGERKTTPQMPEGSEGRMLYDNGSTLQVWHDTAKGEVVILTRLACSPQIERQLLQAQATMNVTIGRYRGELVERLKIKD